MTGKAFRSVLVVLALALGISARMVPAQADTLSDIKAAGAIRIAVPEDFPPFGTEDPSGALVGYDIDVAQLVADDLAVRLVLVPVASNERIDALVSKRVDLIISSLGKTRERSQAIDFSHAYAPFYSGIFAPSDIKITDPSDLAGKTVGVTRGSIEDLALADIAPADATIMRYDDNGATIAAFLSGSVDAIATGNIIAATIMETGLLRRPEPKFLISNSPCYIGVGKGEPALLKAVNSSIDKALKSGALNAIALRWLHVPLPSRL
ncbi:transporter substrate-binding domain-containing protein [Martelella alba]|uniref:Transporter substrate-binding domain-containing protein n=1 Tax=Martelella alba TaxID=2590451 RepID=A0A506U5X3_9HYPH|nr:transporter substrate-binding domain-containing protein [Martelella alba]TPW28878.1 transporter substrate-binding domain-containing protein [Martelella alba]